MPSLKLTNLQAYRAYFADIATQHKEIAGYKWGSDEVMKNDNRSDMAASVLWALPYDGVRYNDSFSDNITKTKKATVSFLQARDSEVFADEEAQYDACETIAEQIIARILRDKRGVDVAGEWHMLATRINTFTLKPVIHTFGSTPYIGWEISLEFLDNANLAFDASKWEDTD